MNETTREMWQGGISNWAEDRRKNKEAGLVLVLFGIGVLGIGFYGLTQEKYFKPRIQQVDQMQRVTLQEMEKS